MIHWDEVKGDFAWDGALRDIYITPATLDDWTSIWPILRTAEGARFSFSGQAQEAPSSIKDIFESPWEERPMLSLKAGSVMVVFHFFAPEEIECDVDPRCIVSQTELDSVLGFIRQLGNVTGKNVIITPENFKESPIVTYDPKTKSFAR